jgi:uncharacterized membrane protein
MQPHPIPPHGPFGRGFFPPAHSFDSGTSTIEWVLFALLLTTLILVGANLALAWSARSARMARAAGRPSGFGPRGPRRGNPFAILGERYARGDISRDEFVQATDDLRAAQSPPAADAPTLETPREDA